MRMKLFGTTIVALAVLVLPTAALAAPGDIRNEGAPAAVNSTFKAHSENLIFRWSSGWNAECERNQLNLEVSGENTASIIGGSFAPDPCQTLSPRIEFRYEDFRGSVSFTGNGTTTTGEGVLNFVKRTYDRAISPNPIALCRYESEFETTSEAGTDELELDGWVTLTEAVGSLCEPEGEIHGTFRLQGRSGEEVVID